MADPKNTPTPAAAPTAEQLAEWRDALYHLSSTLSVARRGLDPDPSDAEVFPFHAEATDLVALSRRTIHAMAEALDLAEMAARREART